MNKVINMNCIRFWFSALFLATTFGVEPASASDIEFQPHNVQTFYAAETPSWFVTTRDSSVLPQYGVSVGLALNYTNNLLTVRDNDIVKRSIVGSLLTGDLMLAFSGLEYLQLDVVFPYHIYAEIGHVERDDVFKSNYPGDARFGLKFKALDHNKSPVGLGVRLHAHAPTGNDRRYLGNTGPEFGGSLILDSDLEAIRLGMNLGYTVRDPVVFYTGTGAIAEEIDDQLTYNIAMALPLAQTWELVADIYGSTVAKNFGKGTFSNPIEGTFAGRFWLNSGYSIQVGIGRGFTSGIGMPEMRTHVVLAYRTPRGQDRDNDSFRDWSDKCPGSPEDMDKIEDNDGCPDFDRDSDLIQDGNDRCPNDKEDLDGFEDEDGCPDFDNDGDEVIDEMDSCPMELETRNNYQDADGCPDDVKSQINVKVSDMHSGEPLSGAIKIIQTGEVVQFKNGVIAYPVLEAGQYTIQYEVEGYHREERTIRMTPGQSVDVDVKLTKAR